jgi:transposase
MCRPSLVQPPEIRRLRDLTRYRRALVQDRTREQQRMEKLLEDAQIKISAVLSNLHGVTGRAIMDALIAGERDPRTLAGLAKGLARKKTDRLEEALRGFFTDHHATILQMMFDNSDRISAQIAALDARIEEAIGPFSRPAARLADIPGVNTVAAAELLAEIGVDMTRFPSAAHLVSWAKFCPQIHQSAGKSISKGRAKGNPWLAGTLAVTAQVASCCPCALGRRRPQLRKPQHSSMVECWFRSIAMMTAGSSGSTPSAHRAWRSSSSAPVLDARPARQATSGEGVKPVR